MNCCAVQGRGSRYRLQVTTVLLGLGLVVSFCIALGIPFPNEDLFLAFCAGRDTVHGLLGAPNHWSYTIPVRVWVDQSWLAHLLFYLSYIKIGAAGPILIKGLLLAPTIVLLFVQCTTRSASLNASLVAVTLGVLALAPSANVRAHLFGMLLLVILAHLLTLPAHRHRMAQIGSVLVIGLWSNLHGSFMLGFFLLALRAFVEMITEARFRWLPARDVVRKEPGRARISSEPLVDAGDDVAPVASPILPAGDLAGPVTPVSRPPTNVLGWLIAVVAAVAVMAFANPYGPENLLMPFHQTLGTQRTVPWVDWQPLLNAGQIAELGTMMARSVVPVLVFLGCFGMLLVAVVLVVGPRGAWQWCKRQTISPNTAMEILLPMVMIPLMFKYGRMVIFAVPILIPAVAALMTRVPEAAVGRFPSLRRYVPVGVNSRAAVVLALLWLVISGFLFYRNVAVPLQPDNPRTRLRPDDRFSSQLLSYNFVGQSVAQFMKRNGLGGRIFSNLSLSDYLLLEVPGIQVFMDLRAHSAYPAAVIEAAAWLTLLGQSDLDRALGILDHYRVAHVVLDTCDDKCRDLLHGLMSTKKWGCIYQEENGCIFVLARTDSPAFRSLLDGSHADNLWYETPEDRTVAEAIAWVFARNSLPRGLRDRLESVAQRRPDPDIYPLIAAGSTTPLPCLDEDLRNFFKSEFQRLAGESYLKAGGERSVIMSVVKLAEILEADACNCIKDRSCETYAAAQKRVLDVSDDLRRRYRPF